MSTVPPHADLRRLAAAAILGPERAGGDAGTPGRLLSLAAVSGTRARAGHRPSRCGARIDECPTDGAPVANPGSLTVLSRLLAEPDAGLIVEWAECAHARGLRVAERIVPAVLEWWCRQPQRTGVVFSVCGRTGEWLASLNPSWRKPVAGDHIPPDVEQIWQTGRTPERLAVLLTIRAHEPARGLALVQSTWASDGADERRRFMEALAEGATLDDEPFLEAALDDKSKLVRRAAASVLGTIPGSRRRARINEIARTLIAVHGKKGILRSSMKVALKPPESFEKAWERDGIEEQAAGGKGKRAWWLHQIVAHADLSVWTEATGLDPEGFLDALAEDDFYPDALSGIAQALRTQADLAWARALVRRSLTTGKLDAHALGELVAPLEPTDAESVLLEATENKRLAPADRWRVLALTGRAWSPAFSSAALKVLRKALPGEEQAWTLYEPVERVSRCVRPEHAEDFVSIVESMFPGQPSESFRRSIDRARLRAQMHKEFAA